MGLKTDRIAALEQELAESREDYDALSRENFNLVERVMHGRRIIEATVDLDFARIPQTLLDRCRAWLDFDPRPLDPTNRLHYLQIEGGDALVWRLVSELVALHDAEAERLGEPRWADRPLVVGQRNEWRAQRVHLRCPDCGRERAAEAMEAGGFDPPDRDPTLDLRATGDDCVTQAYDPPERTVGVGDLVRLRLGDAGTAYVEVSAIDWSEATGWTISGVSPGEHPS